MPLDKEVDDKKPNTTEPRQERDGPPSVRDSIVKAVETETAKDTVREPKPKREKAQVRTEQTDEQETDEKVVNALLGGKNLEKDSDDEEVKVSSDEKEDDEVSLASEKADAPVKEKAPSGLAKEVTDNWDKLPSEIRQYITRTQKEYSDTKAALGRREAQSRDMDTVLQTYEPAIRQLGVTPAQTVDRLFQWMNALAGPHKVQAAQQLLKDFGISLNQQADNFDPNFDPTKQTVVTDPKVAQLESTVQNLIAHQTEQQKRQEAEKAQAALETVNTWAGLQGDGTYKSKPHFESVRGLMFNLIQTGVVPLLNGRLDLDGAYEQACYAHPQIRAELEKEKAVAKAKEAASRSAKEVEKAKKAGISLKGVSPSVVSDNKQPRKANGSVSVRDSIVSAVQEVRT